MKKINYNFFLVHGVFAPFVYLFPLFGATTDSAHKVATAMANHNQQLVKIIGQQDGLLTKTLDTFKDQAIQIENNLNASKKAFAGQMQSSSFSTMTQENIIKSFENGILKNKDNQKALFSPYLASFLLYKNLFGAMQTYITQLAATKNKYAKLSVDVPVQLQHYLSTVSETFNTFHQQFLQLQKDVQSKVVSIESIAKKNNISNQDTKDLMQNIITDQDFKDIFGAINQLNNYRDSIFPMEEKAYNDFAYVLQKVQPDPTPPLDNPNSSSLQSQPAKTQTLSESNRVQNVSNNIQDRAVSEQQQSLSIDQSSNQSQSKNQQPPLTFGNMWGRLGTFVRGPESMSQKFEQAAAVVNRLAGIDSPEEPSPTSSGITQQSTQNVSASNDANTQTVIEPTSVQSSSTKPESSVSSDVVRSSQQEFVQGVEDDLALQNNQIVSPPIQNPLPGSGFQPLSGVATDNNSKPVLPTEQTKSDTISTSVQKPSTILDSIKYPAIAVSLVALGSIGGYYLYRSFTTAPKKLQTVENAVWYIHQQMTLYREGKITKQLYAQRRDKVLQTFTGLKRDEIEEVIADFDDDIVAWGI